MAKKADGASLFREIAAHPTSLDEAMRRDPTEVGEAELRSRILRWRSLRAWAVPSEKEE